MIPWLLTVALNHLRNRQRKLSRERKLVERLAAPDLAPPAHEAGVVDWRELRRALDSLSSLDRELVLLVAWDELTPAAAPAVPG
jgi:DNA-directed RNA polymerase specialized sigma24 family protein